MSVILSFIIACTIALGAPIQPSQPASQPAPVVECMEDQPCWDSSTMGNLLPPMSPSEVAAWDALATIPLQPSVDNQRPVYAATLDHQPAANSLPLGYFVIAGDAPNVFHMFEWVIFYDA